MNLNIPERLAAKVNGFPESSYGATTVTLVLRNGRRVEQVILSGTGIVKVRDRMVSDASQLDFSVAEIVDVVSVERPRLAVLRAVWQQLIARTRQGRS